MGPVELLAILTETSLGIGSLGEAEIWVSTEV
jgi:hypothetical protein